MISFLRIALPILTAAAVAQAQEFEAPIRLEAAGGPIYTDVGHAHPFLYDFQHNGKPDLLVGQFGEGKLRIYKNVGMARSPKFGDMKWFEAGGEIAKVPAD